MFIIGFPQHINKFPFSDVSLLKCYGLLKGKQFRSEGMCLRNMGK